MNPSTSPAPRRSRVWRWLIGLFLGMSALFVLCLIGVASLFFPSREVAILRDELGDGPGRSALHRQVQFSLGGISSFVIRNGFELLAPREMEPEARLAVSSLRGVSVGVYRRSPAPDAAAVDLKALDARMAARGWVRMVTVLKRSETVLVFAPADLDPEADDLRLCVAVSKPSELVLVSARADLAPLLELAGHKMPPFAQLKHASL